MKQMDEQQVEDAWERLYASLPPEVAEVVRRKNEEDIEKFSAAAEAATPSQELKYWAKRSCKDCYGRGHCGVDLFRGPVKCRCANVNYKKWLTDFRKYYNALREIARAEGYRDV